MKLSTKVIMAVIVGSILLVGSILYLKGYIFIEKDAHPPCDMLPSVAKVNDALASNQDFIEEIKLLGDDIVVEPGQPCIDDPDRGLALVRYNSKSERNSIAEYLGKGEGIGVPVHLEKR